jgi:hypothetical protein
VPTSNRLVAEVGAGTADFAALTVGPSEVMGLAGGRLCPLYAVFAPTYAGRVAGFPTAFPILFRYFSDTLPLY